MPPSERLPSRPRPQLPTRSSRRSSLARRERNVAAGRDARPARRPRAGLQVVLRHERQEGKRQRGKGRGRGRGEKKREEAEGKRKGKWQRGKGGGGLKARGPSAGSYSVPDSSADCLAESAGVRSTARKAKGAGWDEGQREP